MSCAGLGSSMTFHDLGEVEQKTIQKLRTQNMLFLWTKPCPGSYDCFNSIHATTSGHLAGSFSGFETRWYSHRQFFQSHVLHQSHWSVASTAKYEGLGESGTQLFSRSLLWMPWSFFFRILCVLFCFPKCVQITDVTLYLQIVFRFVANCVRFLLRSVE